MDIIRKFETTKVNMKRIFRKKLTEEVIIIPPLFFVRLIEKVAQKSRIWPMARNNNL